MSSGKIILGPVQPKFYGEYDASKSYKVLSQVVFKGLLYQCVIDAPAAMEPGAGSERWVALGASPARVEELEQQIAGVKDEIGTDLTGKLETLGQQIEAVKEEVVHPTWDKRIEGIVPADDAELQEQLADVPHGGLVFYTDDLPPTTPEGTSATEIYETALAAKDLANGAKTVADGAKTVADSAKAVADSAANVANEARTGLNGKLDKTGGELSGHLTIKKRHATLCMVVSDFIFGQPLEDNAFAFIHFTDSNRQRFGAVRFARRPTGESQMYLEAYDLDANGKEVSSQFSITCKYNENGKITRGFQISVSPAADSNNTEIATTAWVRNLVASVASGASIAADIPTTMSMAAYSEDGTETTRPLTTDELFEYLRTERNIRLAEYDAAISRLNREKRGLSSEDEIAAIDAKIAAWDAWAAALCALPSQPGAPWDGGGSETPWPAKPGM